ncbi:MAG: YhcH/YjgK/YiaL family protein [Anaerolineae bacterium]
MILDTIPNANRYLSLNPGFAAAFVFLARPDLRELPAGRYEIEGDRVYALVQRQAGRKPEAGKLEAHKNYIDIQVVLAGVDTMGWRPTASCQEVAVPYNAEKDVMLFADRPTAWVAVGPDEFAIFFPEDAHLPMISDGELHKVVLKVRV